MPVKKKAKGKTVSESELRKLGEKAMADFTAESQARYDKARKLYDRQDADTQDALDRMTSLLCRIARRHMWVGVGKKGDRIVFTIAEEIIFHNMFYMANMILMDLAQMDVRVAGFQLPSDLCAHCLAPLHTKKAVKKSVRKSK